MTINDKAKSKILEKKINVLVVSGGTKEKIDQVRYLGNFSSGKMGEALVKAIKKQQLGLFFINASLFSAQELFFEIETKIKDIDILIMPAAVADYTPKIINNGKLKKTSQKVILELEPTIDILKNIGNRKDKPFIVGFCLEAVDLIASAKKKLIDKNIDMIVVNSIDSLGSDQIQATVLTKDQIIPIKRAEKIRVAETILKISLKNYNCFQKKL